MFLDGPVRRPTEEEFKYFNRYIASLEQDPLVRKAGFVKIVPPSTFRSEHNLGTYGSGFYSQRMVDKNMRITAPIRQRVQRMIKGAWKVVNVIEKENIRATNFIDSSLRIDKFNKRRLRSEVDVVVDEAKNEPCEGSQFVNLSEIELRRLEEWFWKKIDVSGAPLYGADFKGSFFEAGPGGIKTRSQLIPGKQSGFWNLNHLHSLLDLLGARLSGVNVPYLYFGQYKAMFPWHTEDVDLHSINYLHFGLPKQWYAVSPDDVEKMYELGRKLFPAEFRTCREYFRHKVLLIDPEIVVNHGITVYKAIQYENEFVITFSGAFHTGFNYGTNCAESVNFGTESWLNRGESVLNCWCTPESVHINVEDIREMSTRVDRAHEWSEYLRIMEVLERKRLIMPIFPSMTSPSTSHTKRKFEEYEDQEFRRSRVKLLKVE
jgi:hypothetical protein